MAIKSTKTKRKKAIKKTNTFISPKAKTWNYKQTFDIKIKILCEIVLFDKNTYRNRARDLTNSRLSSRRKEDENLNWNLKWNKILLILFLARNFRLKRISKIDIDKRNWLLRTVRLIWFKTIELKSIRFPSHRLHLTSNSPIFCYQNIHVIF